MYKIKLQVSFSLSKTFIPSNIFNKNGPTKPLGLDILKKRSDAPLLCEVHREKPFLA